MKKMGIENDDQEFNYQDNKNEEEKKSLIMPNPKNGFQDSNYNEEYDHMNYSKDEPIEGNQKNGSKENILTNFGEFTMKMSIHQDKTNQEINNENLNKDDTKLKIENKDQNLLKKIINMNDIQEKEKKITQKFEVNDEIFLPWLFNKKTKRLIPVEEELYLNELKLYNIQFPEWFLISNKKYLWCPKSYRIIPRKVLFDKYEEKRLMRIYLRMQEPDIQEILLPFRCITGQSPNQDKRNVEDLKYIESQEKLLEKVYFLFLHDFLKTANVNFSLISKLNSIFQGKISDQFFMQTKLKENLKNLYNDFIEYGKEKSLYLKKKKEKIQNGAKKRTVLEGNKEKKQNTNTYLHGIKKEIVFNDDFINAEIMKTEIEKKIFAENEDLEINMVERMTKDIEKKLYCFGCCNIYFDYKEFMKYKATI